MKFEPIYLEGETVRLLPLQIKHLDVLCEIGLVEEIWTWYPFNIATKENMLAYIEDSINQQKLGLQIPFIIIEKATNKVVGSTRFMNIDVSNFRVEIGSTWLNPQWQRTAINTEAKLLMLTHAFETWKCMRVEFKTDSLNEKSRRAILRLGAKEEGTLRNHMITESGRFRDSVYFSIIEKEWKEVKADLLAKLRS